MIGVVDTSALIRLYIPDGPAAPGFEKFMRGVERGADKAIAPELLLAECGNVLNRKRKMEEISAMEARELLSDIASLPIRYLSHLPLISTAFDLAEAHGVSVYDALYLSLAVEHEALLFTADNALQKIAEKLSLQSELS